MTAMPRDNETSKTDNANEPDPLVTAATALARRLAGWFADDEFRREARAFADAVLRAFPDPDAKQDAASTQAAERAQETTPAWQTDADEPVRRADTDELSEPDPAPLNGEPALPAAVAIQMLSLGGGSRDLPKDAVAPPRPAETARQDVDSGDESAMQELGVIATRCRVKADASRWAAKRLQLIRAGHPFHVDIEPRDSDLIAQARALPECFLWMIHSSGPNPADLSDFELLAECYDLLAHTLEVVDLALTNDSVKERHLPLAMKLLAESQSMLNGAVLVVGGRNDSDQRAAYATLHKMLRTHDVFIDRYMRTEDAADPNDHPDLAERIETLDQTIRTDADRGRTQRKLLGKVRYEARTIRSNPAQFESRLETLLNATQDLIDGGLPPSNLELREAYLPIMGRFDEIDELPPGVVLVMREIDRFLARNPNAATTQEPNVDYSDEVLRLRDALRGRAMVMIGGERRPLRQAAIEKAFELKELIWDTADEHTSNANFMPAVSRDDVAVVLLAIRWSSHSYGDMETVCRELDRPFVRLPAGTNANQIAHQVIRQVGQRLLGHSVGT